MNDPTMKKELNDSLKSAKEHFASELTKLRTGRAHPSMVEDVMAEAYGVQTPLKQLATITTPEPQQILISPFDASTVAGIASSIRNNQTLGLNPTDDGRVIRIQIPALTTERRQQIVKQLGEKQEEAMIGIRKSRQEAMTTVSKAKKDKEIGEDEASRFEKEIESLITDAKAAVEELAKIKETDILKI
jgi:ribosome recycling factor